VTILTVNSYEAEDGREATLWMSAALVVCALHVGLAAAYLLLKPEPEARAEAPAFEVAFVPATTTPAPAVPETQQAVDQPPAPDPSVDPPTETPPPPQAVVPESDPPPAQVEALVQPEPTPPPLALSIPEPPAETKVPEQVAVLPPPEAKPVEIAPPPPPERTTRKPVPDEKVQKESGKPPSAKPAAAPGSRPARVAMAPNTGAESEGAREGRSSWQSELVAHIRRFATYNSQSNESGSVSISVTIDRNGRLKSRHLVSSSGSRTRPAHSAVPRKHDRGAGRANRSIASAAALRAVVQFRSRRIERSADARYAGAGARDQGEPVGLPPLQGQVDDHDPG
jgi:periplasmic protein TonB